MAQAREQGGRFSSPLAMGQHLDPVGVGGERGERVRPLLRLKSNR
jgi:hypothetical protein